MTRKTITQKKKKIAATTIDKNHSNSHNSIKHNAVRSKQHSFIAQLSARVQEVNNFASLLSLCTGVSYKLTEQLMLKTMQTYTVIINTKNRIQKETWCIKKKKKSFLFCTEFHQKSLTRSHTHTGIKGERSLPNTNLLWFLNQLICLSAQYQPESDLSLHFYKSQMLLQKVNNHL